MDVTPEQRPNAALLEDIARAVRYSGSRAWDDEHARWELYQRAFSAGSIDEVLREALSLEPDEGVATSVVLLAFEKDESEESMSEWVDALPEAHQRFVAERARELLVLRSVKEGTIEEDSDITKWTHWLQREAAVNSAVRPILARLARDGVTRKIRNIAAERLRVGDRQKLWGP